MKLNKKLEAEIKQVMEDYWGSYLKGDLETWAAFLPDDYKNIGTTREEIWNSKKEIVDYTKVVLNQMVGMAEVRNKQVEVIAYDPYIMVHELGDIYIKMGDGWAFYSAIRLSSLLQKTQTRWKILHQHGSYPDSKTQEGEAWAFDTLKAENEKLQEAVKNRTIELENKNRELQIEAALERVRTVAMAMQRPDDLLSICETLFYELKKLGFIELRNAMINIHDDDEGSFLNYDFSDYAGKTITTIFYNSNTMVQNHVRQIKSSPDAFAEMVVTGKELEEWREFRKRNGEQDDPRLGNIASLYYYFYSVVRGDLGISNFEPVSEMQLAVLKRFSNVFDLAYQRYTDITTAEAQSREALIELALEKVRARTMAMQKSDELAEVSSLLFHQMMSLQVNTYSSGFTIWDNEANELISWMCNADGSMNPPFRMPIEGAYWHILQYESWRKGEDFIIRDLMGEEMQSYFRYLRSFPLLDEAFKKSIAAGHPMPERQIHHVANFSHGNLLFITIEPSPRSHDIFKRFGKVFDQTYTRFLDLQKAEAQVREAQIEAALERVRSRTMGMQKSEELGEVSHVINGQLQQLNFKSFIAGFLMDYRESDDFHLCRSDPSGLLLEKKIIPYFDHPIFNCFIHAKKTGLDFYNVCLTFEEKNKWVDHALPYFQEAPQEVKAVLYSTAGYASSCTLLKNVGLFIENFDGIPFSKEENVILMRFGKVFEQTYTRFLDLQKAEAQAKEAQVESALERVRSRTMAMHKSEELGEAAVLLYKELKSLGVTQFLNCGYVEVDEESNIQHGWMTKTDGTQLEGYTIPLVGDEILQDRYDAWKRKDTVFYQEVGGDKLKNHTEFTSPHLGSKEVDEMVRRQFPDPTIYYCGNFSHGYLHVITGTLLNAEEESLLTRFTRVFEMTYKRFLDLKKAEAQAREARIEASLERVRSRTMAMQRSDELAEVAILLFQQVKELGITAWTTGFNIWQPDNASYIDWITDPTGEFLEPYTIDLTSHPAFIAIREAKQRGDDFFVSELEGQQIVEIYELLSSFGDKGQFQKILDSGIQFPTHQFNHFVFGAQVSLLFITYEPCPEAWDIFKRFGKVFEQTYTRFLDLQKAEAQAREAQIETALERVRSRTMGMQKSEELKEIIQVVYEQFVHLNIHIEHTGFIMDYKAQDDMHIWIADRHEVPSQVTIPYFDCAHWNSFKEAKEKGIDFFANNLPFEEKNRFYQEIFKLIPGVSDEAKKYYFNCPGLAISTVLLENVGLYIENFSAIPYTDEENNTLMRFGNVFQQTYTRFLDLQKAEAQAREATIEAALEKVRSRSLAMHKSDEIKEVVTVVMEKMNELNIEMNGGVSLVTFIPGSNDLLHWYVNPAHIDGPVTMHLPYFDNLIFNDFVEARNDGKNILPVVYSFEEKNKYFEYAFKNSDFKLVPEELKKWIFEQPYFGYSVAIEKHSAIFFNDYTGKLFSEKDNGILKRFSRVFEQAYIRFLDLQKAEAQARESQIEAAMEKVRSRALAMQKPGELVEVAKLLRKEMNALGVEELETSSIYIHHEETGKTECWYAIKDVTHPGKELVSDHMTINLSETSVGGQMLEFYRSNKKQISIPMQGAGRKEWINYCAGHSKVLVGFYGDNIPDRTYHLYKFSNGYMGAASPGDISAESWDLLQRATSVFSLAYTRFSDLQQAEAQAREANVEAALERVRSRTLGMQNSDELADTAAVLFKQLILLGIEPNRLYITIIKNETGESEFWITDEDGSKVSSAFESNMNDNPTFKKMFTGWHEKKKSLTIDMKGKELETYFRHLGSLHVPFKNGVIQKRRLQYIAYFSKGFIGMASPDEQPEETIILLERFAAVFNLTFTRFNDLKIAEGHARQSEIDLLKLKKEKKRTEEALAELQFTQKQLIQSEKMASLGELTAGIAHEIQNPLNFVNNFSELSNELLDEMLEEVKNGNYVEVKAIVDDIKQNLQKINHHGKRADGIVKGMLQHSRTGGGQREPTNINALADEYLRLAYHGLRAKDKNFNAILKTDYDQSITSINVIPRDIGRVILNLINNAFYTVDEKRKSGLESPTASYEPTVSVTSIRKGDKVEIAITDNGNGIPAKVLDKIFQPFFTTKPTGHGPGLGLSMAYDIIKAHGGELQVKTKEGKGTTFLIQLPA